MMKKVKVFMYMILLALSVAALSACGRNSGDDPSSIQSENDGDGTSGSDTRGPEDRNGSSPADKAGSGNLPGGVDNDTGSTDDGSGSAGGAAGSSVSGGSRHESTAADRDAESKKTGEEESTGVLDGLMDDVERGLDDMAGDSEGPSNNADESDNR